MVYISSKVQCDLRQLVPFEVNIIKLHNPIQKPLGIVLNSSRFWIYTFEQAATFGFLSFRFYLALLSLFTCETWFLLYFWVLLVFLDILKLLLH